MKRLLLGVALSTFCLAGAACNTTRVAVPIKPDADRMDCVAVVAADRPAIPPEYVIDWSKVLTVAQARTEHDAFVRTVRTREGVVSGYIVDVEGRLFACSSDAAWLRDFYAALPD
jgi:hypothetical protein